MTVSGAESPEVVHSGRSAVWEVEKFLSLSLQKHGVVEGWTPEPAGLVARGSFKASDSIVSLTNRQGSIR